MSSRILFLSPVVAFALFLPTNLVAQPALPKDALEFKLPSSSEAKWLEKKQADLERYRKTMRFAYDKVGRRNPKWDDLAHETLDAAARAFSLQIRPTTRQPDVFPLAKKALDAGCDDPMIVFMYSWSTDSNKVTPFEYKDRIVAAAQAMSKSKYAPLWRSYATRNAAQILTLNAGFSNERDKGVKFLQQSLDDLVLGLKEDRSAFASEQYRKQAADLLGIYLVLKKDWPEGFDVVDKALAKVPSAKDIRLKTKAAYLSTYAWEGARQRFRSIR